MVIGKTNLLCNIIATCQASKPSVTAVRAGFAKCPNPAFKVENSRTHDAHDARSLQLSVPPVLRPPPRSLPLRTALESRGGRTERTKRNARGLDRSCATISAVELE